MNALIRNSSELETYVVSVERVDEYASVAPEVEQIAGFLAEKNVDIYIMRIPSNWQLKQI